MTQVIVYLGNQEVLERNMYAGVVARVCSINVS